MKEEDEMKDIANLLTSVSERLRQMASNNAVVARKISVGERHVLPLCELSLGFGGAGMSGEANDVEGGGAGKGAGGGAGGMAKAAPVAVIIVDGDRVRIESLNQ